MINKALRIGRIIISLTVFILLTAGLTVASVAIDPIAAWISRIQLLPAVATFSIGVFVVAYNHTGVGARLLLISLPHRVDTGCFGRLFHRQKIYRYRKPFSPFATRCLPSP